MPRTFDPAPLMRALKIDRVQRSNGVVKAMSEVTGINYRQLLKTLSGKRRISEDIVDRICCHWLGYHPSYIYGDLFYGNRIQKYMAELDALYGTNVSDYCSHEYEVIHPDLIIKMSDRPMAINLIRNQEIALIACTHCEEFTHAFISVS